MSGLKKEPYQAQQNRLDTAQKRCLPSVRIPVKIGTKYTIFFHESLRVMRQFGSEGDMYAKCYFIVILAQFDLNPAKSIQRQFVRGC